MTILEIQIIQSVVSLHRLYKGFSLFVQCLGYLAHTVLLQEQVLAGSNHLHGLLPMLTSFPRILISYSGFFFVCYSFLPFPREPA